MSFFQPNMLTTLYPNFDEKQWIKQIRQTLDEELDEEIETAVTIFSVPRILILSNPHCYIPHQVAIGPYHHLKPELYEMERYKVAAAKRNQREFQHVKFEDIVDYLVKSELHIRACYHKPLSYGSEALAWMMAVDASFLYEFFQVCGVKGAGKVLTKTPSRLAHLLKLSENKNAHNAILRDIVMLENQIPLFVMRILLEFQYSSEASADEMLLSMLIGITKELCPFKTVESAQKIGVATCAHLLDFLYHRIVPEVKVTPSEIIEINEENCGDEENKNSVPKDGYVSQLLSEVWRIMSKLKIGQKIKSIIFSRPIKVIVKLPWKIFRRLPVVNLLKEPIENMCMFFKKVEEEEDEESNGNNMPPLQNKIAIPTVCQLVEVGVQFVAINEGITSIKFDAKTLTFYVPIITLDVNSEVVIRNVVAYEACGVPGPLVFTRYTELMDGIIDTDEDAKFLCKRGIIINHLKSEKEVAELWNGMSKSIRLTKVHSLDKVIADVNKYYNGTWKVKLGRFMRKYVFGSWRILTFLAAIVLLLLMCLQAFCEVYICSRFFQIKALGPMNND